MCAGTCGVADGLTLIDMDERESCSGNLLQGSFLCKTPTTFRLMVPSCTSRHRLASFNSRFSFFHLFGNVIGMFRIRFGLLAY